MIDTLSDAVVATIWAKPNAADLLGAAPNAAAFDASGRRLYVANGSQNAIAVFEFDAEAPQRSRLLGMIPVGWYPGAVLVDDARGVVVAGQHQGSAATPGKVRENGLKGLQFAPIFWFAYRSYRSRRLTICPSFQSVWREISEHRESLKRCCRRDPISHREPFRSGSASPA